VYSTLPMALGCSVGLGPLVGTRLSCARTLATQFGATRRIQAVQLPYRQGYDFVVQALVGQAGHACMHAGKSQSVDACMHAGWLAARHVRNDHAIT
jgi:hypothetical protein